MPNGLPEEARASGEAIGRLAQDEATFGRVLEAYRRADAQTIRGLLDEIGVFDRCWLLCSWIASWECIRVCRLLCGGIPERPPGIRELNQLGRAVAQLAGDDALLERLVGAVENEDPKAFASVAEALKLGQWCVLLCYWVCRIRFELMCELICEQSPPQKDFLSEVRSASQAVARLVEHEGALRGAAQAYQAKDIAGFRQVLERVDLLRVCHIICFFLCTWRCIRICLLLCREILQEMPPVPELREIALRIAKLSQHRELLERLTGAFEREDSKAFGAVLEEVELLPYCHFVCHWLCFLECDLYCRLVCPPPAPLPLFRKIGGITYSTQIASAPGGTGLTLADSRAFYSTLRLNGVLYQKLYGAAMEYRFEIRPLPGGSWTPVLPDQIAATNIGTWTRWTGNPGDPVEAEDYTLNGTSAHNVNPAADGWIQVPQEDDFWTVGGTGQFTSNGNMINLISQKIAGWPTIDVGAVAAGQSTAPAGLGQDLLFGIRMRVRQVGNPATEMSAGTCETVAIYNRLYDNVTKGGAWAPNPVDDQLGAAMVNVQEIGSGCGGIKNSITIVYTAAHPNLSTVAVSLTGPGGPFAFTMTDDAAATVQDKFGQATPTFNVANLQDCAYLVTLSAVLLLTTGDSVPNPILDHVAFCKK